MILSMAFRNIFRQKRRSLITSMILVAGYLVICWSISIAEGSYSNIINKFTKNFTGHIQLHKKSYLDSPSLYKTISSEDVWGDTISDHKDVLSYSKRLISSALLYFKDRSVPAKVIGVDPAIENQTTGIEKRVKEGSYWQDPLDESERVGVLLGYSVAKTLRVGVGDIVIFISGGYDGSVANDLFRVQGILSADDDSSRFAVYMPLAKAQEFYFMEGKVHEVSILLSEYKKSDRVRAELLPHFDDESYDLSVWKEVEKEFYKAMQADKKGNQAVLFIIALMVIFSVLNTIFMSVMERTREYGLIRALGGSGRSIALLVLYENMILTFFGILCGLIVGACTNLWLVHYGFELSEPVAVAGMSFSHIVGEISFFTMGLPVFIIFLSVLVALVFPVVKAVSIQPQEALRSY